MADIRVEIPRLAFFPGSRKPCPHRSVFFPAPSDAVMPDHRARNQTEPISILPILLKPTVFGIQQRPWLTMSATSDKIENARFGYLEYASELFNPGLPLSNLVIQMYRYGAQECLHIRLRHSGIRTAHDLSGKKDAEL